MHDDRGGLSEGDHLEMSMSIVAAKITREPRKVDPTENSELCRIREAITKIDTSGVLEVEPFAGGFRVYQQKHAGVLALNPKMHLGIYVDGDRVDFRYPQTHPEPTVSLFVKNGNLGEIIASQMPAITTAANYLIESGYMRRTAEASAPDIRAAGEKLGTRSIGHDGHSQTQPSSPPALQQ